MNDTNNVYVDNYDDIETLAFDLDNKISGNTSVSLGYIEKISNTILFKTVYTLDKHHLNFTKLCDILQEKPMDVCYVKKYFDTDYNMTEDSRMYSCTLILDYYNRLYKNRT